MDYEKVRKIQARKKELMELGLFCTVVGPTGPTGPAGVQGEGINVLDTYRNEEELYENHPVGTKGESYLVNSNIFIWSEEDGIWKDAGSIKGPKGDKGADGLDGADGLADKIAIMDTITLPNEEDALVEDNYYDNTHHLTFLVPKGKDGLDATFSKCSTESILFTSFAETNLTGLLLIQDSQLIQDNNDFIITGRSNILVKSGLYEIAFSGCIENVDTNHGGIFYLKDDANQVVMDLSFQLLAGTTTQMHFSQNVIHNFDNDTTLEVMAGIVGASDTSNVRINDVNLLMKKIHI